jgi:hypothetical protein
MKKTCPHCGREFDCRHNDIWNCDCLKARLTPDERKTLNRRYPDQCLCLECLTRVKI